MSSQRNGAGRLAKTGSGEKECNDSEHPQPFYDANVAVLRRHVQTVVWFGVSKLALAKLLSVLAIKRLPPRPRPENAIFGEGTHNKIVFVLRVRFFEIPGLGVRRSSSPTMTSRSSSVLLDPKSLRM